MCPDYKTKGPYDCPGGTLVVNSFEPGGAPGPSPTMGIQMINECTVSVIWTVVFYGSTVLSFTVGPGSQQTATFADADYQNCDWGASALF
jgi:hypothetical protein